MKKRSSLQKTGFSKKREDEYRKDCEEILFKNNLELVIKESVVYLKLDNKEMLLVKIDKEKSMWYEIWLKLKII